MRHASRNPSAVVVLLAFVLPAWACRSQQPSNRVPPLVEAFDLKNRPAGWLGLPAGARSVKFAVIGDSGRGSKPQYEVSAQMQAYRARFPFSFVLMVGDNLYEGPATAEDYRTKFEDPYRPLLDAGVQFYAVLGNHDDPNERNYAPFHMNGHRYYTFKPPTNVLAQVMTPVRFFALDSTSLDSDQLAWVAHELSTSDSRWKICFLHHPLYSSGRYRLQAGLTRWQLESLFVQNGVDVVFSGHEHIYERVALQQGVQYFISGGAGSLRRGDARPAPFIARSLDTDFHFMLIEIDGGSLYFQAVTRTGETADAGVITQP